MSELSDALIGRKIVKAYVEGENGYLVLDNGKVVEVVSNDGCGGCSAGWYEVTKVSTTDNVITSVVQDVEPSHGSPWGTAFTYTIFVFTGDTEIAAAVIEGDDGNGYYGSGYYINIKE